MKWSCTESKRQKPLISPLVIWNFNKGKIKDRAYLLLILKTPLNGLTHLLGLWRVGLWINFEKRELLTTVVVHPLAKMVPNIKPPAKKKEKRKYYSRGCFSLITRFLLRGLLKYTGQFNHRHDPTICIVFLSWLFFTLISLSFICLFRWARDRISCSRRVCTLQTLLWTFCAFLQRNQAQRTRVQQIKSTNTARSLFMLHHPPQKKLYVHV